MIKDVMVFFKQLQCIWLCILSFVVLCIGFVVCIKTSHITTIVSCVLYLIFIVMNFKRNKNNDFKKKSKIFDLLKDILFAIISIKIVDVIYYDFLKTTMLFSLEIFANIIILQMIILFILYENYNLSISQKQY